MKKSIDNVTPDFTTQFSILMSVYGKDDPKFFRTAVESVLNQTVRPTEIILVVDGPVPVGLGREIANLCSEFNLIRPIELEKNGGLGNALRIGMTEASNEIVARMDSDDIAHPDRFAKQLAFLKSNPEIDIVGGQIEEFINSPDNIVGKREVPLSNKETKNWLRKRCPFNHMTVMMRKSKVIGVGNYIDWHYNEDYYLWIRMAEAGCNFANLPDTLVSVRVGKEMYQRRGGWKYFKSEKKLQDYMLSHGIISFPQYCFNTLIRFGVQVAIPNKVRGFIFQKLFRK